MRDFQGERREARTSNQAETKISESLFKNNESARRLSPCAFVVFIPIEKLKNAYKYTIFPSAAFNKTHNCVTNVIINVLQQGLFALQKCLYCTVKQALLESQRGYNVLQSYFFAELKQFYTENSSMVYGLFIPSYYHPYSSCLRYRSNIVNK